MGKRYRIDLREIFPNHGSVMPTFIELTTTQMLKVIKNLSGVLINESEKCNLGYVHTGERDNDYEN